MFNYANGSSSRAKVQKIVAPVELQKSTLPISDPRGEKLWLP
jgi:hypothetical protein